MVLGEGYKEVQRQRRLLEAETAMCEARAGRWAHVDTEHVELAIARHAARAAADLDQAVETAPWWRRPAARSRRQQFAADRARRDRPDLLKFAETWLNQSPATIFREP